MSKVLAICTSDRRGIQKSVIKSAEFEANYGIKGDAHAGDWHRQISLLGVDKIIDFRKRGANVEFGAFGENLVVEDYDFRAMPVGTLFRCGEVLLEMTQIGKECHSHCTIYHQVGDCIMPREGVFARVLHGGTIKIGDEMVIEKRVKPRPLQVAIVNMDGSDVDESAKILEQNGYEVAEILALDKEKDLKKELKRLCDQRELDLVLIAQNDEQNFSKIINEIAENMALGIAESIRANLVKAQISPKIISCAKRKKALIINFSSQNLGIILAVATPNLKSQNRA